MPCQLVSAIMVTVYVAEERLYIDGRRKAKFSVNGTQVEEVYGVKGAIAHRGRSLRCTNCLVSTAKV